MFASELSPLRDLSSTFEVMPLVRQCEENIDRLKLINKEFDSCKKVELSCPISHPLFGFMFPTAFPADVRKLKMLYSTGEYSDIKIYLSDHGLTFQSHKVILSLWSVAFAKVRYSPLGFSFDVHEKSDSQFKFIFNDHSDVYKWDE